MATLKKLLPPVNWQWQQTMLRVKDSKASTAYYCEHYGMTLICFLDFPEWSFDLSFLASLPEEQTYDLDPASAEAKAYCFGGVYGGHGNVCLELTHNYGTEAEAGKVYHAGNAMEAAGQDGLHPAGRDGFGHVAFNCDDVYAACTKLEGGGVEFKKKPDEGRMKGLAFAYDPDGYWVEICSRGKQVGKIANAFNLSQTMMRIKDPALTIPFYTACGMTLLRQMDMEKGKFSNYFLASLTPELKTEYEQVTAGKGPTCEEAAEFVKGLFIPVLELTHNWGTEAADSTFGGHYSGNKARLDTECSDGRGFGHIGFVVDDVYAACEVLRPLGHGFQKEPDGGNMKGLAFALDPDGYWVEILKRET